MEEFILDDGYVSQRRTKVKPIKYVLGGKNGNCYICISHNSDKISGYYRMKRYGNLIHMHIWVNDIFNDEKSKKGYVVRHICGNARCINPLHLKVGTQSENKEDERVEGKVPSSKFW